MLQALTSSVVNFLQRTDCTRGNNNNAYKLYQWVQGQIVVNNDEEHSYEAQRQRTHAPLRLSCHKSPSVLRFAPWLG